MSRSLERLSKLAPKDQAKAVALRVDSMISSSAIENIHLDRKVMIAEYNRLIKEHTQKSEDLLNQEGL